LAAVARAADRAVGHRSHEAVLMGASAAVRLEAAGGRLADDGFLAAGLDDHAAPDRDVRNFGRDAGTPASWTTRTTACLRACLPGDSRRSAKIFRKNAPVWLASFSAMSSGVPVATTAPPPVPPSGPMSTTQSAVLMTSRLCSITISVLPASTSWPRTPSSLR